MFRITWKHCGRCRVRTFASEFSAVLFLQVLLIDVDSNTDIRMRRFES
jgi:hypothetical protein